MNRPEHPGLRILLVEDNRIILLAISYILKSLGHFVTTSNGVDEALAIARTSSIDLLISDLQLGHGDGLDLIDQIRLFNNLPAIAMSGRAEMRETCLARGYSAFLAKPITHKELVQTIRRVAPGTTRLSGPAWSELDLVRPLESLSRNSFESGSVWPEDLVKTG